MTLAVRQRFAAVGAGVLLLWLTTGCRSPQESPGSQAASQAPAGSPGPVASGESSGEAGRPKIVLLGDSLTAGLGLMETQAYPARLQQRIDVDGYNYEVDNAGVSGDTSAGGLRRLDWALQGNVRLLILALGANDGLRGLSVDEMKNNLTQIIQRARDRNVMVILAGMEAPPNYGQEYAASFRQAFRDVARQERVVFIPFLLDKVAGRPELNQADGIHPNVQGAQMVADTVWNVLRPALDQIAAS
jgi:acyl-CoA thioesterase-1